MRRYYLHQRRGIYYAEIIDQATEKRLTAKSTGQRTKEEALLVVSSWLSGGIPSGRLGKKRPVELLASLESIMSLIRKTDLDSDEALLIVKALKDRGLIDTPAIRPGSGDQTLEKFLTEFWTFEKSPYVRDKKAHGHSIGQRHCYEMMNRAKHYWFPAFHGRRLNELTRQDIKDFLLDLAESGLAAGSINKIAMVGSTAFAWAAREGKIPADPSSGLQRFSGITEKRGIFTPEEAAALFTANWQDKRAKIGNMLAATTGMRSGEVLAVRVSDIEQVILQIRHSYSTFDGLKAPKNGEARRVPLLPEIRKQLLELAAENPHVDPKNPDKTPDPYIFYSSIAKQPMDAKVLLDGLKAAAASIGIDSTARSIVFHSWRHYYSARMNDVLDAKMVMRATGHKTQEVFDGYAAHALESDMQKIGKAAASVFGNILPFDKAAGNE